MQPLLTPTGRPSGVNLSMTGAIGLEADIGIRLGCSDDRRSVRTETPSVILIALVLTGRRVRLDGQSRIGDVLGEVSSKDTLCDASESSCEKQAGVKITRTESDGDSQTRRAPSVDRSPHCVEAIERIVM
jgi:hypothetical protein